MAITKSFHFEAPVEKVFGFFTDPNEWSKADLLMDVHDVHVTKDGVGTNFEWTVKLAGVPFGGFEVLTEVVPNKHITERSSMAMTGKWSYDFEQEDSGTKVTFTVEPQSIWKIPPLARLVEMGFARISDVTMPRFQKAVEASAAA